jgi:hypothetical protein
MTSHTRCFLVPLTVALMVISVPTGDARAALILDQVFDPGPSRVGSVSSGVSLDIPKAQTFTVGLAGVLVRVDVDIVRQGIGPLLVDVRATTGGDAPGNGAPIENDATTLASLTIPAATVPTTLGFFSVDVSGFGIAVTRGEILAIVLRGTRLDTDYGWAGFTPNPYPAGAAYFRNASAGFPTWTPEHVDDLGFKTFVAAAPGCGGDAACRAPAPSTVVLFGAGLAALAGVTWRRRRGRTSCSGHPA